MITWQTALSFFSLALLLSATPGPDNLFVLMQSAASGRRVGMSVVIGLCLGLVVHTTAVALGLAAVFAASAAAFTAFKVLGSAYLLYLAWKAWSAPAESPSDASTAECRDASNASDGIDARASRLHLLDWRMVGRGLLMNVTNPKVLMFFLALLPQFVRPASEGAGPVAAQIACLGALFIVATLLVFGAVVLFASAIRQRLLRSAGAQLLLNRAAALVFAGLAAKLALSQRT